MSDATPSGNYGKLLASGGFEAFLWTQFLGAFNDNVYKMIVSLLATSLAVNQQVGARYLSLAGAAFVLPYILFAGHAGQLADRFSKTRVLQITKALEIITMLLGLSALVMNRIELLLGVLFLLGIQANFFSPAKYGILPEMMGEAELTAANGLVEFSTLAAIVLGTSFGSFLIGIWKQNPWRLGTTLLAIAVVGSLASLGISKVPACGSAEPFHWNPFYEVWMGCRRMRENRALAFTIIGLSYFWFIGALFQMAVLLLGSEILHESELRIGLLVTALALGIGLGSIAAGWISRKQIELGLVPLGGLLLGFFSIVLSVTRSYAWDAVWLVAIGIAGGLFFVPLNAFLQERSDTREKGRMLATNNFVNMVGIILASGLLSLLHDKLHWSAAYIIGALGAFTILATVFAISGLRDNRTRSRIHALGAERIPRSGAILVSNHVTHSDAALIAKAIGRPVRVLRDAAERPKPGELVCFFPEREVTPTGHVQVFQPEVEQLFEDPAGAPVIPIYLDGLWPDERRRFHRPMTIMIGEPVDGRISAPELRQRVMELGTEAVNARKAQTDTLPHRLIRAARRNWSQPAIADSTRKELTYGKTLIAAILVRNWLNREHGGERHIGLLLPTSVGGAIANFGVTLAGRAAVNLNFTSGDQNCRSAIEQCGIRTVLTSRVFLEKAGLPHWPEMGYLEDLLPRFGRGEKIRALFTALVTPAGQIARRVEPDDVASVLFSSGSTGVPKGIELTHWNVISNIECAASVFPMQGDHCMLGVLPFFHSFGYTFALWFPIVEEIRAAFHPNPTEAKAVGDLAQAHRATFFLSTPTFCTHYIRKCTREQFATLRFILVGAEKIRTSVAEEFEHKFGVGLLPGYGATELGPCASVNTPEIPGSQGEVTIKLPSVGRPLPGVSVRVVHPDTRDSLPPGEQGMLLVKSPSQMKAYFKAPEKTAQAMHEGFYVTGDLAYVDEDGFLYITDRLARFSKVGGEMVPHLKIEEAVAELIAGSQAFVTGIPDERKGERLVMLYTSPDLTPAQFIEQLNSAGLPQLWIPKRESFYHVDTIPLLGTGKIDLAKARALAMEKANAEKPSRESTLAVEA